MKLGLTLAVATIATLGLSTGVHAQGGGSGSCVMTGDIDGTYSMSDYTADTYAASISATFMNAQGNPTGGYATGYPKLKYKFYMANGTLLGEPGTYDPVPYSFGIGGYGSVNKSQNGTLSSSLLSLTRDMANNGATTAVRQWKLLGYAGTSSGQAQDSINKLSQNSNTFSVE